jgi:phage terminase small subunit
MAGPGRPGRLSANAAGSPEPDSAPGSSGFARSLRTRLKPPADLGPEARAVFIDVVVNSNPEHFQPSDVPLLCVYAEAVVQARACAKLISEGNCLDPVIKAQRNALSAVFQLSMRLRVSPQARQVRKSLGSNTRPPTVNYYDRLQLEMGTDEEN